MQDKKEIRINPDFKVKPEDYVSVRSTGWALDLMKVSDAHNKGVTGSGVSIAVGDTGLNDEHPNLPVVLDKWQGEYDTCNDDNGHGSHVLGIAYSVAPDSHFMVGKIADANGSGTFRQMKDFIYYAVDNFAKVINLSLGAHHSANDAELNRAIEYAYNRNVLVVIASGNEGDKVGYPARHPKALAIGAINQNKITANFQNEGLELDFVAPGVDILSAWLGKRSIYADGTSQAAPFVTGFAALLIQEYYVKYNTYPLISELIHLMKFNSIDLNSIGFDHQTGHGMPSAEGEDYDAFKYGGKVDEIVENVKCNRGFFGWIKSIFTA